MRGLIAGICSLLMAGSAALVHDSPGAGGRIDFAAESTVPSGFSGAVVLGECSGSLVRMSFSTPADPGLILTNGHCLETGFLNPGQVVSSRPSNRSFTLLSFGGDHLGTLRAKELVYSTMTGTDVALYQLTDSYDSIESRYGVNPFVLSAKHPVAGASINVISGRLKKTYSCSIDGFVHKLREGAWTWEDSVRYTRGCDTIAGTSGSPVVDDTGRVVTVNNTSNRNGEKCTVDNPCEVDPEGTMTVHRGASYAEETYMIPACLTSGSRLDLKQSGCTLPRP